jgi:hypothetical protein
MMEELNDYRRRLVDRLEAAAKEFRAACLEVKDIHAPIEPGGWNVHQVVVHTRDVEVLVYGLRARRTLQEDNPEFPNFDGEAYLREHYDPKESLRTILDGLVASVESLVDILRDIPVEGWSRPSRHATQGGGLTLQIWVERGLAHIEEHLTTVRQAK